MHPSADLRIAAYEAGKRKGARRFRVLRYCNRDIGIAIPQEFCGQSHSAGILAEIYAAGEERGYLDALEAQEAAAPTLTEEERAAVEAAEAADSPQSTQSTQRAQRTERPAKDAKSAKDGRNGTAALPAFFLSALIFLLFLALTGCARGAREPGEAVYREVYGERLPGPRDAHCATTETQNSNLKTQNCAARALRLRAVRTEHGTEITAHGTAFAISPRRVLSAAHNIDAGAVISLETAPGRWMPATLLRRNADLDVAELTLQEDAPAGVVLELAARDALPGAALSICGSVRGAAVKSFSGSVECCCWKGLALSLAKVPFDHGLSGAPVLDASGQVIGMAVAGVPQDGDMDHARGLFAPVSALRAELRIKN